MHMKFKEFGPDYLSREANGNDTNSLIEGNKRLMMYTTPNYKWGKLAQVILKTRSTKVLPNLIEKVMKRRMSFKSEDHVIKQSIINKDLLFD